MGKRYVVLGVGRQGLAAVYDLVRFCNAEQVLALDHRTNNTAFRSNVLNFLQKHLSSAAEKIQLKSSDLSDASSIESLIPLIRGFDCIVSALPYALNENAAQLAVRSGVPFCDMGGNPDMVERQKQLAEKYRHVVVPECGLAPGIANVFIKYLHVHHRAVHIECFCGGLPAVKPDSQRNPLGYQLVFSPNGLISEYSGRCPVLRDGHIVFEPALSGLERFDADHEAFFTSNLSPRILEYFSAIGIRNCTYKTLRYHGHLDRIHVLRSLGFFSGDADSDAELSRRLADSPALRFDRNHDRDKVILVARGRADDGSTATIELVDHLDEPTRLTAMERTTSWGTTIVAYALAEGLYRPQNFSTPEQFVDPVWLIDELKRRTPHLTIRCSSSSPRTDSNSHA